MSETRPPVIVTRAEPGGSQTAERLEAMGLTPLLSPALELAARGEAVPDLSGFGGLVFTSANGVRFFAEASDARTLPAWCVGPATASEALREGFSPVHESSGNAHDLAHYIAHHWSGESRSLLHIANAAAKGDLKKALEEAGFTVTFLPLYEARRAGSLNEEALGAIRSGTRTIVLIHSRKGAEAFLALANGLNLTKTEFVAISSQAAAPLETIATGGVYAAGHPDEDHLMACLEGVLANG
ncbi:MAG: uroporphyrinogen-III synthase [Henriciella sp.]|uniref:uroporphyrinogen-III synthase n=1 Tax=Henriciella sp. TaxID=1968823 RepID=UPI0032F093DA